MEKIKFDPSPPLSLREVLPVIDYTGRLYPKKGIASFWKGDTLCGLKVCERGSTFHGWHKRGLSFPVKTAKSVSRGKRLTSCESLPLWNYPGIAPDLSWAGEEWLVEREKRPKYGSVKLEISNWWKISSFKANKPFANKTLRAGRKIRVLLSKAMVWRLFFRDARVTLCKKDTVSLFKKGIWEAYEWLTVRVGQHEREFLDTGQVVLQET